MVSAAGPVFVLSFYVRYRPEDPFRDDAPDHCLLRHDIQGQPERRHPPARQLPVGMIRVPLRLLGRSWFLYEELVVEDVDSAGAGDGLDQGRGLGVENEAAGVGMPEPEELVVVKTTCNCKIECDLNSSNEIAEPMKAWLQLGRV